MTDDRDFVASRYVFVRHKPSTQYWLRAQRQEEIPRCLSNMRPYRVTHSTKIDILLLDERRVGQVPALLIPMVKLFRGVMRWDEFLRGQRRQAVWLAEW